MRRRVARWARAGLEGTRTAWDIFGITLLLLVVVVVVGRGVAGVVGKDRRPRPAHPYAGEPWFRGLQYEYWHTSRVRWEPYVHWQRMPFAGPQGHVNVDSAGFRRTIQPAAVVGSPRKVFFFGGSTMWGSWQRDSFTIPSLIASDLAAHGITDVEVRNFGEAGYVFTQEVIRLMLELRRGERPEVVVFYDGINDVTAQSMNRRCGLPHNEANRRTEFAMGRLASRRGRTEFYDARVALRERLLVPKPAPMPDSAISALARDMVGCYAATAQIVEALAQAYGFEVLYFWQPTIGASEKPLTRFEQYELDPEWDASKFPLARPIERASMRYVDGAMAPIAGPRFHNLGALFTGDTATIWMDYVGHISEAANRRVADRVAAPVIEILGRRAPAPVVTPPTPG